MDKELKEKWVAALRSGAYQQTREKLRDDKGYCCLGVLLQISDRGVWEGDSYVYDTDYGEQRSCEGDLCALAKPLLGDSKSHEGKLTRMNDGDKASEIEQHSFAQIADYIEANL